MRKFIKLMSSIFIFVMVVLFIGCGSGKSVSAIELMGAGDRIHDTYTFANSGVSIKDNGNNVYTIFGSVDKLTDESVKSEFKIADEVTHVVAIKLSAINTEVKKDEVEIFTDGNEAYDAEHLNGSDYTFIILEVVPGGSTSISVKWNKNAEILNYVVNFATDIDLK